MTTTIRLSRMVDLQPWALLPDTGCRYAPKCVDCPLPACAYDRERETALRHRQPVTMARYQAIADYRRSGHSVHACMARFGVSERTIFRALRDTR